MTFFLVVGLQISIVLLVIAFLLFRKGLRDL